MTTKVMVYVPLSANYVVHIKQEGSPIREVAPGQFFELYVWQGAPVEIVEVPVQADIQFPKS